MEPTSKTMGVCVAHIYIHNVSLARVRVRIVVCPVFSSRMCPWKQ